ncbi:unnamed protein product, partial [Polarella glacialis]
EKGMACPMPCGDSPMSAGPSQGATGSSPDHVPDEGAPSPRSLAAAEEEKRQASSLLQFLLCLISSLEGADMMLLPAVFYALQRDLGLSLNDLALMSLFQGLCQAIAASSSCSAAPAKAP